MAGAQSRRAKVERLNPSSAAAESTRSASASNSASISGSASRSGKSASPPAGGRFDGNADPAQIAAAPIRNDNAEISRAMKNMDLGSGAFDMVRGHKVDLCKRPPPSKLGREIIMGLNTFPVSLKPGIKVFQYQILIGSGTEKRGLIKKAWLSKAVQAQLKTPRSWIFDGNNLAWSMEELSEQRVNVDLDAEQGKKPRPDGKTNIHRVVIKRTSDIDFASLTAYLAGKADFNNKCLEAVTFMDHLMRENPSQKYSSIKRSFFAKGQKRYELGGGVEAFKGVYQSLRIAHSPAGAQLTVNVDVANGTFFTGGDMSTVAVRVLGLRSEAEVGLLLKGDPAMKRRFNEAKRLRRLHVYAEHRGKGMRDEYVIDKILAKSAIEHKIDIKDKGTGKTSWPTIQQYFQQSHNIRLKHPEWPVVQMTRKAVLPLELLRLDENQRYMYKLDDRQTASMIKVAVTAPKERWGDIDHGLRMVDWANDPYLKNYGMRIDAQQSSVKARLLENPTLQFDKSTNNPGTTGRWDLKGKKFLEPNTVPLKSWGVCVVSGRFPPKKEDLERFIAAFVAAYKGHGGRIESSVPCMTVASGNDPGKCVEELWNATGNKFQMRPQILCFILPDKDSTTYGRIKRSCECRYGVVSQCMQMAHVQKCQPQYMSNVLMKFNAKLGGVTNRAVGKTSKGLTGVFKVPTCIIGADVSHAAPGMQSASMAALTVSMNRQATRYAAACDTNGHRVEMITEDNIKKLLKPLLQHWVQNVGQGQFPKHIIYVRDGVSEGQFSQVMEQEVKHMKAMLASVAPNHGSKFIVIIASKRHHIRFFPKSGGDRNGNALPGTLVETGVTHPFENDFYLCSHAAIKGTARPVHYNVLLNEPGMSNEDLQTMIYEHSYQYIRATTPVSLFPAVYYAHLASNRAAHHDKDFGGANSNEKASVGPSKMGNTTSSGTPTEFEPLMVMPDQAQITKSMWYI